ncbi:MAG: PaaI family thioesterase [Alphaproteobacteria bacterium]|nr:PaaI family thioesterase [Alphaproteobacteria bacterium]
MSSDTPAPADLKDKSRDIIPLSDEDIRVALDQIGAHEHAAELLGFNALEFSVEEGWIEAAFNPDPRTANLRGGVQGGMICAILDEVMSLSAVVAERFTVGVPTLELKTSFLAPLPLGPCRARGQIVRIGRNVGFMEGTVWTNDGIVAAKGTATCQVRRSSRIKVPE